MGLCNSSNSPVTEIAAPTKIPHTKQTLFPPNFPTLKYASRENIHDIYQFIKTIGKGKFGEVSKVKSKKDGRLYAVKSINISDNNDQLYRLESEINVLKQMDHPNIIKFYETYTDESKLYILTELCNGGEIYDKLLKVGKFSEESVAIILQQILSAVAYLHKQNYCHRDLKPENFLYKSEEDGDLIKLIDFGLASRFSNPKSLMMTIAGSPYYVAPEVLNGVYNSSCDIWSTAIIMYVMISGEPPVEGDETAEIIKNVKEYNIKLNPEVLAKLSPEARTLFEQMLEINPNKRPTAEECLKSLWFKKYCPVNKNHDSFIVSLKKLKKMSDFKKIVYTLFPRFLSEEKLRKIREQFKSLDTNSNGLIPIDSLVEQLKGKGMELEGSRINSLREKLDLNKDGFINFGEFLDASISPNDAAFNELIGVAFEYISKGEVVTLDGLLTLFKREANIYTPIEIKEVWKSIGKEQEGMLTKEEFIALMHT